jgi:hypothetical protein
LVEQLKDVRRSKARGEKLRNMLVIAVEKRFNELSQQTQDATRYF